MFRRRGYAGASIDAIAEASGISGPGIYRYFSGKTELLLAWLESAVTEAMRAVERARGSASPAVDCLADILADRALSEGAIIALLQGTAVDMDGANRGRLEQLRGN